MVGDTSLLDGMGSYTGKKGQSLDYADLIGVWGQTATSQKGRVEGDKGRKHGGPLSGKVHLVASTDVAF